MFAPSMVIGGAFGQAAARLFPQLNPDPATFVLVGMGAFFAGVWQRDLSAPCSWSAK